MAKIYVCVFCGLEAEEYYCPHCGEFDGIIEEEEESEE